MTYCRHTETRRHFNEIADETTARHRTNKFGLLEPALPLFHDGRILEIGCGTGKYTLLLLEAGARVFGIDVSDKSIKALKSLAKRKGLAKNLTLKVGDAFELLSSSQIPDDFDAGLIVNTLHHLPPDRSFEELFSLIRKRIRKDGFLLILEPNGNCPIWPIWFRVYGLLPASITNWKYERGIKRCIPSKVVHDLHSSGFPKVDLEYFYFLPQSLINHFPWLENLDQKCLKISLFRSRATFFRVIGS